MTEGLSYPAAVAQCSAEEAATTAPAPAKQRRRLPDPARHGPPDPSLIHPARSAKAKGKHWTVLVEEIRRNPGMTESAKYGPKPVDGGRAPLIDTGFHNRVVRIAAQLGWLVHHSRPSRSQTGKVVTAVQGDTGAPDLLLARGGVVLLVELKKKGSYPDPGQRAWAEQIPDAVYRLWKPTDVDAIVTELSAPHPGEAAP